MTEAQIALLREAVKFWRGGIGSHKRDLADALEALLAERKARAVSREEILDAIGNGANTGEAADAIIALIEGKQPPSKFAGAQFREAVISEIHNRIGCLRLTAEHAADNIMMLLEVYRA